VIEYQHILVIYRTPGVVQVSDCVYQELANDVGHGRAEAFAMKAGKYHRLALVGRDKQRLMWVPLDGDGDPLPVSREERV
jgi:hypothetical protein